MTFKTIFSMRLAGYLMQRGFVLMDMRENSKFKGKKVFYFRMSNEIEKSIEEYLKNK